MNSSSTLVATVSINYEDFTEGFLTCGTCLYAYDQAEHAPKLLSCSHTICQSCLELIASSPTLNNSAEAGCIKCPICRQNIAIPNGGIGALPPSFLVNQLFDLVNKKPREFIPKMLYSYWTRAIILWNLWLCILWYLQQQQWIWRQFNNVVINNNNHYNNIASII